jgi:cytochrome c oxidase subunit IV
MDANDTQAFKRHLRLYIGVFVALLVGTALTVAVSFIHFGHSGNIAVALIIAVLKALLVAGFFMHLVGEKKSIYTVLAATGFFVVGLMGLTLWAMNDAPEMAGPVAHPVPVASAPAHHVP